MEIKVKYMHMILHGHRETLSFLVTHACSANLRLLPIHARVLTYEHSYVPSTISLWNKLPVHIVNETDFDKFSSLNSSPIIFMGYLYPTYSLDHISQTLV